ncbi:hypothetical protein CKO42_22335 [Lamprobacter modestohalophilus]|uniref:Uncharacterized protein n=1 Tax=Lamprobacter modestohalophilus TaxID=1064514 RepID=A0A9X1B6U7_9GAMM|nr:hypothetical protein [Lamprobacter modestohalophilus]MBK1621107.1 hypothetical protein [Lamprobacter modestohalophilus]
MPYSQHTIATASLLRKIDAHLYRATDGAKPDDAQMTPQHEAMGYVLESARNRIAQLERELLQLRQ